MSDNYFCRPCCLTRKCYSLTPHRLLAGMGLLLSVSGCGSRSGAVKMRLRTAATAAGRS
jgi:hypothetical protein